MQKPLCSICRHRHYSYEDHIWSSSDDAGPDEVSGPPGLPEPGGSSAKGEGPGNPKGLPDNQSSPDGVRPLTPAEKQKRYREKLGDEYRKRNRERMRRNRGG